MEKGFKIKFWKIISPLHYDPYHHKLAFSQYILSCSLINFNLLFILFQQKFYSPSWFCLEKKKAQFMGGWLIPKLSGLEYDAKDFIMPFRMIILIGDWLLLWGMNTWLPWHEFLKLQNKKWCIILYHFEKPWTF